MSTLDERFYQAIKELQSFTAEECKDVINYKDLEAYEKRASTFSKLEWWFAKLRSHNPREIARFGWKLHQKELLYCSFCKSQIKHENDKYYKLLEEKEGNQNRIELNSTNFTELLKNAHEEIYIWKLESIPEFYSLIPKSLSLLLLNLLHSKNKSKNITLSFVILEYLKVCLQSYFSFPNPRFIPVLSPQLDNDFREQMKNFGIKDGNGEIEFLREKIKLFLQKSTNSEGELSIELPFVFLSIFGWKYLPVPQKKSNTNDQKCNVILQCDWCNRTIGVWNFVTQMDQENDNNIINNNDNNNDKENNITGGIQQKLEKQRFDPISQHRHFCNWISIMPKQQLPTWQFVLKEMINFSSPPDTKPLVSFDNLPDLSSSEIETAIKSFSKFLE